MIVLDSGDKIRGDAAAATVVDFTIYGFDRTGASWKQLADGQLAAAEGDLYTSTGVITNVVAIVLVNTDTSARAVNLYVQPSGGTSRRVIPKDMSLGAGFSLHTDGIELQITNTSGSVPYTTTYGAHKDEHDPEDGSDPLDTAAPGTNITPEQANAVGTAHTLARSDHMHYIPSGAPSDIAVANAEGTGAAFARTDHAHDIAGQAGEGHIFLWCMAYSAVNQGTWVKNVQASYMLNGDIYNTSSADGDELDFQAFMAAGTYTLMLYCIDSTDKGIIDIDIDASEVASFDLYAATPAADQRYTQASISVATSGLKTITYRVDGKNASSSNYYAAFQCMVLWRTA